MTSNNFEYETVKAPTFSFENAFQRDGADRSWQAALHLTDSFRPHTVN